ncbi:CPBP family intramembrane metalloprotease [Parabacteroides sp. BX2]|uniref:CPBP family intramembrane metalloprotease n=1 Tax=Parabacteroides segnis TaxID=2763058 RepID=A0ABR7DWD7_9BACT|nr:CPBP family intramembrane glutamic endopeptidase [Parabacteroides segnis]MBC5641845.1 CPBP family intramembrane metalloprotease [Parabacteroides segnis]
MENKKQILTKIGVITLYFLIAIGLRYVFAIYRPPFLSSITDSLLYVILTGIGPLIGALFVIILFKRKIEYSSFGLSVKKTLLSVSIPICLFFLYDLFTKNATFSNTLIVITCLLYAYCEESGWRGYLQSELINLPTLRRVSIITIMWFIWHLNFNVCQSNALFLLILFLGSWGIGQIAINTRSIIVCGCFHAIINILSVIQIDIVKIFLIIVSVLCWFGIWYIKKINIYMT